LGLEISPVWLVLTVDRHGKMESGVKRRKEGKRSVYYYI